MNSIPTKKLVIGTWYGAAAGTVFSIFCWGLNSIQFFSAKVASPWFNFMVGWSILTTIMMSIGRLSVATGSTLKSFLLWSFAGILAALLGILIPLYVYPQFIFLTEPQLVGWVEFSWRSSYGLILLFSALYTMICFAILGILENSLVDSAYFSLSSGQLVIALFIVALISGLIGGVNDSFANANIRKSTTALDEVVTYFLEHRTQTISKETSRLMRLGALNAIKQDLSPDHQIFIYSVNETFDQTKLLIRSSESYAICYVFVDQLSNCMQITPGEKK